MSTEERLRTSRQQLQDALLDLGFSPYEAKCYVGLVGTEGLTGYGVAKVTGVPQPKVYETLRKLVRRGAAQQIGDDPALFHATPPEQLLKELEASFRERHDVARQAATSIAHEDRTTSVDSIRSFRARGALMSSAEFLINDAKRRIYISASVVELDELLPALREAAKRNVDVIVLDFAPRELAETGMLVFRHASTDRALYRHHQARHLAMVVDSHTAINAIAVDGDSWDGVQSSNAAVIAAVKGLIRHDIDLQQVYADFGPTLVEAYGPGLQMLESYRVPVEVGGRVGDELEDVDDASRRHA